MRRHLHVISLLEILVKNHQYHHRIHYHIFQFPNLNSFRHRTHRRTVHLSIC